ncbi:hypothetical protein [Halobacterium noricense]|uniref:hypothetical protein n=1 Tax=Halobacterium noricense TaxID=223182 RepID=UPI001E5485A0|nr:hypothetical protein [Halobacterium noricense]UHH27286.1 hypothetical protein LT974_17465 [Halobacterium noricense]
MVNRRRLLASGATAVIAASSGCLSKNSDASSAISEYRLGHGYFQDAEETSPNVSETKDRKEPALFRESANLFKQAQQKFSEAKQLANTERAKKIAQIALEKSALKSQEMNQLAQDNTQMAITKSQLAGDRRLASVSEFKDATNNSYFSF